MGRLVCRSNSARSASRSTTGRTRATVWASEVRIANGGFLGGVEMVDTAELDSGEIIIQAVTGRAKKHLFWNWFAASLRLHRARRLSTPSSTGQGCESRREPPMDVAIDGEACDANADHRLRCAGCSAHRGAAAA